jgi:tellurite resistance protein TerC
MQEISIFFWIAFHGLVFLFLVIDLLSRGRASQVAFKTDLIWTIIWITVGLLFGAYVFWNCGYGEGVKYMTAYVAEKSLSIDNLFVFLVIFGYFAVPFTQQHKTLFLGILGAVILRGVFIFLGITLLERFHWMVYVFGVVLIYSGYRLARGGAERVDPEKNKIVRAARRILPIYPKYVGSKFITRNDGKMMLTPLIIVLIAIETTDIVFAFDSVPAVLAITGEFFTAYTSNIMAILGLRSLYFILARAMIRLRYLGKGLAIVLFYLGTKFLLMALGVEIPTMTSLTVVMSIVLACILISLVGSARSEKSQDKKSLDAR